MRHRNIRHQQQVNNDAPEPECDDPGAELWFHRNYDPGDELDNSHRDHETDGSIPVHTGRSLSEGSGTQTLILRIDVWE